MGTCIDAMQCLSCATELLHAANFCPVCGARLAAPAPDGTAATLQPDTHMETNRRSERRTGISDIYRQPGGPIQLGSGS